MFHKRDIRLDQLRLDLVVAQPGLGIESTNELMGLHNGLNGPANRFGDFLVLLVLQEVDLPFHDFVRIFDDLIVFRIFRAFQVAGLDQILELGQKALAQVAGSNANGIKMLHQTRRGTQVFAAELKYRSQAIFVLGSGDVGNWIMGDH